MRVLRADGAAARRGTGGTLQGEGRTGEVFPQGAGGLAWGGLAADPFTADGLALAKFLAGLAAGQYDPRVFTSSPGNIFAGRDVTAIALQIPDADLGGTRVAVWARISLVVVQRQLAVPVRGAGLAGRLRLAMWPGGIELRLHPGGPGAPGRSSRRGVR